jgi:hypothetical protein
VQRALSALAAGLALVALAASGAAARNTAAANVRPLEIEARPIPNFQSLNPGQRRFGKLDYRGGLVLTSRDASFGGWSGLVVAPDGRRMMAISDEGTWFSAEIDYRDGAPIALNQARIGPILALKGRLLGKKRDFDAESITLSAGDLSRGTVLIGFERNHRIGVFPVADNVLQAPVRYLPLPPDARRMRSNSGFEAIAVLRGGIAKGSVVAFAERVMGSGPDLTGWIWKGDTPRRFSLVDHGGFDVTDATSLGDGALIVLERRFRWTEGVKMRLRRIAAGAIKPDATVDGEILLEADLSSQIDNMEGVAVHRTAGGETVLTLISDNNFNTFLQRNLLLQFTLPDETAARKGR